MSQTDPLSTIMDFIQNELSSSDASITSEDDLLGGGHINSMGIMRLVAFLESEFGMSVPPEDVSIEHFETGRTITDYVQSQLNQSD